MKPINVLIDGNYLFTTTFGVFGGFGSKDPAKVLSGEAERSMFIRKVATDLSYALRALPVNGRIIFTIDSRSWRKDVEIENGGYKSGRKKDENVDWSIFYDLLNEFGHHLESKGIILSKVDGAEGDDLIAFWAVYIQDGRKQHSYFYCLSLILPN